MSVPVLAGPRVRLRPPTKADIAARQALGSDLEIHRLYGGSRSQLEPFTDERAVDWFRDLSAQRHAWVIDVEGRLIGEIRLHSLNDIDQRAALAVGIADAAALGQGYGTEAIRLVLTHAFGTLGMHRIGLRVLAYNERAIASYRKCGFEVEGRERESALVDGEWYDDIIMGIIVSDFLTKDP